MSSRGVESLVMGAVVIAEDLDHCELERSVTVIMSYDDLASSNWCRAGDLMLVSCHGHVWDRSAEDIVNVNSGLRKSITTAVLSVGNLDLAYFSGALLEISAPPVASTWCAVSHCVFVTSIAFAATSILPLNWQHQVEDIWALVSGTALSVIAAGQTDWACWQAWHCPSCPRDS